MRTKDQVNRVCHLFALNRRQRSILHMARKHIDSHSELLRFGMALLRMTEQEQMNILNGVSQQDNAHTQHLSIMKPYPDFVSQFKVTKADLRNSIAS